MKLYYLEYKKSGDEPGFAALKLNQLVKFFPDGNYKSMCISKRLNRAYKGYYIKEIDLPSDLVHYALYTIIIEYYANKQK